MSAISEKIVENLPIPATGNKVHFFSGAKLQGKEAPGGFGVRVTAGGTKAFVWFHRVEGKKHLETLGAWEPKAGGLTAYDAIAKCIERRKAIAKGFDKKGNDVDPRPERTRRLQEGTKAADGTVASLLDVYIARYLRAGNLRSAGMIEAQLERLVKPKIGKIGIYDLKRSHVSRMLDDIADENGKRMADLVLAYVRKAFNWYEVNGHDDDFTSPIVRGMARLKPSEQRRERPLDPDEIRDVWAALDTITEPACFPAYVKTLLLTATRRNEVADMPTTELDGDVWTIPAARYKTKRDHVIPLSSAAAELIRAQAPATAGKNAHFIFSTTNGAKAFAGFSKAKRELDKAIADIREREGRPAMKPWHLHDLRHTARTLLAEIGIRPDVAERCLGHVVKGIEGVYNHHDPIAEKRAAFEALAALVARILSPSANVEELAARRVI